MHKLAELCINRPVFATVLILVLLVFGVFGYMSLGVDRFPKIDIPIVTITTVLPGSAPEEIETEISDKIEEAVNTVSGIDELRSVSMEGISQVFVSFNLEKNVDIASQEVRDKINRILSDLPDDIEQPKIEKMDPDASPIMAIALSGPVSIRELTEYADKKLRRRLESIAGVGQVMIVGGQKRQINIKLDPIKLKAYNLTVSDVSKSLENQNLEIPGGTVKTGMKEFSLRTLGRVKSIEELNNLTLSSIDGHTVKMKDVGLVEDGSEEVESLSQLNNTQAILLNIRKQSGTNTLEVVSNLKERLKEISDTVPPNYKIEITRDQSIFIRASFDAVQEHLVLGSILAAIVVFIFLANFRTTLIAAIAIPTSIISTFAIMKYMGFTLNMLTMLALTLSVGIVIDDAIVVLENIFRFVEEKRHHPFKAAKLATKEIGLAVLSITLSLVAVFVPIAFMTGIIGRFMTSFGITMASAILISMFVSFTLTPMLASRFLKSKNGKKHSDEDEDEAEDFEKIKNQHEHSSSKASFFYSIIEKVYLAMLKFCLKYRFIVVIILLGCFISIPTLFKNVKKNFLPDDDQSEFQVTIRAPEGTSLEASNLILLNISDEIRKLNGVVYSVTSVADTDQKIPNLGNIYVRLCDVREREFDQFELMNFIRKQIIPKYAKENLRITVNPIAAISGGGMTSAAIQYMIGGPDIKKLEEYSTTIISRLKNLKGTVDVDSSLIVGKPEYGVVIDRERAAELGVSVKDIAKTLKLLVAGDKVTDYNDGGEKYDVHIQAGIEYRNNLEELQNVSIPSSKLGTVSLRDVVKFKESTGPSQINRLNRQRQVSITANLEPNMSQQAVLDEIAKYVKELNMPPEYKTGLLGQSKEFAKSAKAFAIVFLTAFLFVYLVLAAQYESWLYPIIVLLTFPMTLPFALFSVLIFNQSLNIFSTLGVLVLFAVVKKNAILQIDHTNQLRREGLSLHESILAANLDRLRPILMTTIAFVAGMLPLMLSKGAGAGTNKTISSVIVGGQTLSLLLTLLAVPVIYSLFDDMIHSRLWGWLRKIISKITGIFSFRKKSDA